MSRLKITQSLLSNWQYIELIDSGWERFIAALNREEYPASEAIYRGKEFEKLVNDAVDGMLPPENHQWLDPVKQLGLYLNGSMKQVEIRKNITVDGLNIQLHGILDFLKAGVIYDTKFCAGQYHTNKYLNSPQHPMYFELVPQAYAFQYLICDGKNIYTEEYRPEDTEPIQYRISRFLKFIERCHLEENLMKNWSVD